MSKTYNLKKCFEHPIVMYEFGENFKLKKGVSIERIVAFFSLAIGLLLIRLPLNDFISVIPGSWILFNIALPVFLSGYIVKTRTNGKKLIWFIVDYISYMYQFKIQKNKVSYDEYIFNPEMKKFKLK